MLLRLTMLYLCHRQALEKIESIRDWGRERAVPASGKPIGEEELLQKKSGPKTRKVLV